MNIINMFNEACMPQQPFTSESQCLKYVQDMKQFLLSDSISLKQIWDNKYDENDEVLYSVESRIYHQFFGQYKDNIDENDIYEMQQFLSQIRDKYAISSNLLPGLRKSNKQLHDLQLLLMLLTGSPDLSQPNVSQALLTVSTVRSRCETSGFDPNFISCLLSAAHLHSDFKQFAFMIPNFFETSQVPSFSSAQVITDFLLQGVKKFEHNFSVSFKDALNRCIALPDYVEPGEPEFLRSEELKLYQDFIYYAFGVKTEHPIHFAKVYFKNYLSQLQAKAVCKSLEKCVMRILNLENVEQMQNIILMLSGTHIQLNLESPIEHFCKETESLISSFNNKSSFRIEELVEFAVFENYKNIETFVHEDKKIMLSLEEKSRIEKVLSAFQIHLFGSDVVHKQPTLTLVAVLNKLHRTLAHEAIGIMPKLALYDQQLQSRASMLLLGKELNFNFMKLEVISILKNFTCSKYISLFTMFLKASQASKASQSTDWQNSLDLSGYNQFYIHNKIELKVAEIGQISTYINELFQTNKLSLLNLHLSYFEPIIKLQKQSVMAFILEEQKHFEDTLIKTQSKLLYNTDQLVTQCQQNLDSNVQIGADYLFKLCKYDVLLQREEQYTTFVVSNDIASVFVNVFKQLGLKYSPTQATFAFMNLQSIKEQIFQDFMHLKDFPLDASLFDQIKYLTMLFSEDNVLVAFQEDKWHESLCKMLITPCEFFLLTKNKTNYRECLQISLEMFQQHHTLERAHRFGVTVHPNDFLKMNRSAETILKEFQAKAFENYIKMKFKFGNEFKSLGELIDLLEKEDLNEKKEEKVERVDEITMQQMQEAVTLE
ncbi:Conserved_hypothetical protein [Hexamita inflata]|uniref:Uncharacterized protein n=1 Tax=Hexamita inflata TaxID=28002 RepID=A0AA86Q433_9EUKA|nr:Conserved hypothetical protein [Hexamita inflata]